MQLQAMLTKQSEQAQLQIEDLSEPENCLAETQNSLQGLARG